MDQQLGGSPGPHGTDLRPQPPSGEEESCPEAAEEDRLSLSDQGWIEGLFAQAAGDPSKAFELKREPDRRGVSPILDPLNGKYPMTEPATQKTGVRSVPEVRTRLRAAAVQSALTDLLEELGRALEAPEAPPAEVACLAEGAAHQSVALHRGQDVGLAEKARHRLEGLVLRAEARAPAAAGLARRLIDTLASLGI